MKRIKLHLSVMLGVLLVAIMAGCAPQITPYETNNEENYTVSVKYDANGGTFTTNTFTIVDSYNLDEIEKNSSGEAEIALLAPDDSARGNDAFTVTKNGYFLAGWYAERIENTDSEGNTSYTYSGKWNFENDLLSVDASKEYTSEEPVLTLYAAWIPLFEIEFYAKDTGEFVESLKFDPTSKTEFSLPAWDEETGVIKMYDFPERTGYTFEKAYLDAEGKTPVKGETLTHTGVVNYETGTSENSVMKLYVDYAEGEWYRIYTAEQFVDCASLSGSYEILADLDFSDEIWPTAFMYGNFTGTIKGNGHTISNVSLIQTNNSKVNAGLFGYITDGAAIEDITFDNVTFTIKSGTRVVGTSYGLFAGTLSSEATIDKVAIKGSTLEVDSSCYFATEDYTIGLVCGMGNASVIEDADIECVVVGDNPEKITIDANGNTVTLEFND